MLSNLATGEYPRGKVSRERGFGFLKNPLFFADSIYLKSPERIEALVMIFDSCLIDLFQ
jgi:transposase